VEGGRVMNEAIIILLKEEEEYLKGFIETSKKQLESVRAKIGELEYQNAQEKIKRVAEEKAKQRAKRHSDITSARLNGSSIEDVAKQFGIKPVTVRSHMKRASKFMDMKLMNKFLP
jgi:DNA-directed RNA polymerase specialized sigma24 family protein